MDEIKAMVAETAYRLMTPVGSPSPPGTITNAGLVEIETDEMCRFYTETNNGQTVLVEDCGCGNVRKFALMSAASGNARSGTDEGGAPGNAVDVSPSNANCYASSAADIIVQRMKDYASQLLDVVNLGIDLVDIGEELADFAGEIIDILRNKNRYAGLDGIAESAVFSSIDGYKANIQTEFTYSGSVTRREMIALCASVFPDFDGSIPIGLIANGWALGANIRQLNAQLAIAAAECETGASLPQVTPVNATFGLLLLSSGVTVDATGGTATIASGVTRPIRGFVYEITSVSGAASCGSGNPRMKTTGSNGGDIAEATNFNNAPVGWSANMPPGPSEAEVETALGVTFEQFVAIADQYGIGDVTSNFACASSGSVTFGSIYAVVDV